MQLTASFSYWFTFNTDGSCSARLLAWCMPPRSSDGSGCDGPPNNCLVQRQFNVRLCFHIERSYTSRPKNCINLNFAGEVLLLRYARTSCIPWLIREANANEMTVEPELYSMIVFDFAGSTFSASILSATRLVSMRYIA